MSLIGSNLPRQRVGWPRLCFQNDYSCFVQNAVSTGTISEIQTNRELPLEKVSSTRLSFVLRARRTLGMYRIPRETGLLISSGKRNIKGRPFLL